MILFRTLCLVLLMIAGLGLKGQTVDCARTANLSRSVTYSLSGTAHLERFEDGTIQLRLGDDFSTSRGPDVQIYLSNDSTSIAGGVMIADIGSVDGLNHFSGAISFDVPSNVTLETYEFVVFRCITFQAFWGSGRLGPANCDDPGMNGNGGGQDTTVAVMCSETLVATTNWASELTICPNDGIADVVALMNTGQDELGVHYAYVFADGNNNIRFLHFEDSYDFEGSSLESDYIFGVSYYGDLNYNVGDPISSITADTCAQISSLTTFLTVNKINCASTFDCVETNTATTNWVSNVTICPGDGTDDIIPFLNNQFQEPGDHYAYLLTDTSNLLIEVILASSYNFEDSGNDPNRVFGISYAGTLNYNLGEPITNITADSCFTLSDQNLFLTVEKGNCATTFDCVETNTATTNWVSNVTICPGDGTDDIVPFLNNQFQEPGDHYAYLLTDTSNLLIEVILTPSYNFEDSGNEPNRVFGISYAGNLNYNVGEPISNITADSCFMLSDQNLFLTIEKGNCVSATFTISGKVTNSKGDAIMGVDIMDDQGTKVAETDEEGVYLIEDLAQGATMTLSPEATSSLANGITSTDLVLVVRHILDLTAFVSPYQLIAADANNSGTISASDLVQMKRALLGASDGFSNNSNWRFIDAAQQFDLNLADFSVNESVSITIDNVDHPDVDFIGVKIGDVNINANVDLR